MPLRGVGQNVGQVPQFDWRDHFIRYREDRDFYIYCDTNASYASIHQFLEDAIGQPVVVANGNAGDRADAGACLAISYEARARGISRGMSLRAAKKICPGLRVFESCLPLYEFYAEIFDHVLAWIVHPEDAYRGSCDEVAIRVRAGRYPWKSFAETIAAGCSAVSSATKTNFSIDISTEQLQEIKAMIPFYQVLIAIAYLCRDMLRGVIGIPISIGIAPSIALAKTLLEYAKPIVSGGVKHYQTFHDAICFPLSAHESAELLRPMKVKKLCGVQEIADRLEGYGIRRIGDVQDLCDIPRLYLMTKNKHLSHVVWYMCHGRDDILSGYLAAIRDRK